MFTCLYPCVCVACEFTRISTTAAVRRGWIAGPVALLILGLSLLYATGAFANGGGVLSGCDNTHLYPETSCYGENLHDFLSTYSEDVDNTGVGSCTGVSATNSGNGTGEWIRYVCVGDTSDGSGPDPAECNNMCYFVYGYGFAHNHSASKGATFFADGTWYS
jgi:hypothetical protein